MFWLSSVMSAFVQLALALVIPGIWWVVSARGSVGFAAWLGLRRPSWNANWIRVIGAVLIWVLVGGALVVLLQSQVTGTSVSRVAGLGVSGIVPVLFQSLVQTSLSEEIFFRGFLGKRFIARWGFVVGNAAQAALFGLMHVAMFVSALDPIRLGLIGALTGASGWLLGWINERQAGGSIAPGWVLHASVNLCVGLASAFSLLG